MHTTARPVLLAYDGSTEAKHAIATAGELLGGHAVVVHAYATPTADAEVIAGPGVALAVDPVITAEAEQRAREQARAIVDEGVAVAGAAGFDAQPELVPGDGVHAVWNAIVALAERYDASVIVVGHGDGVGQGRYRGRQARRTAGARRAGAAGVEVGLGVALFAARCARPPDAGLRAHRGW
jgi:nucleotide-binding universal stress UspA family protein